MNCSNCGADLEPGASFCPSCGASAEPGGPEDARVISSPEDALVRGEIELASIGQRAAARIIDVLILGLAVFILFQIGGGDGNPATSLSGFALSLVIGIVYEVGFVSTRGQTPGKIITKIKIVELPERTNHPTPGRAFIRYLVPTAVGAVPFLGVILSILVYVSAAWDELRQGWHDKAARTLVVKL